MIPHCVLLMTHSVSIFTMDSHDVSLCLMITNMCYIFFLCLLTPIVNFSLPYYRNLGCFGFRHVKVYCNSDNALAGLIREIGMFLYMFKVFICVNLKSLFMEL